ncbi:hypothetical protein M0802_001446 [Mischocyttarus mexicanus]|nr:hypothetical protein M0802_001446 [Mischocyttarus mexicanus]
MDVAYCAVYKLPGISWSHIDITIHEVSLARFAVKRRSVSGAKRETVVDVIHIAQYSASQPASKQPGMLPLLLLQAATSDTFVPFTTLLNAGNTNRENTDCIKLCMFHVDYFHYFETFDKDKTNGTKGVDVQSKVLTGIYGTPCTTPTVLVELRDAGWLAGSLAPLIHSHQLGFSAISSRFCAKSMQCALISKLLALSVKHDSLFYHHDGNYSRYLEPYTHIYDDTAVLW